ncbi:MAG TPA: hypothetical protein VFS21_08465 [Roseiflexaceae bacterium]|nr:hypothetical protein [Roseiflexaceae bacterium]
MTPQLQPMGIGDILDAAIRLYRNNFRTMLTIGAALLVPVALLQLFSVVFFGGDSLIDLLGNAVALPMSPGR